MEGTAWAVCFKDVTSFQIGLPRHLSTGSKTSNFSGTGIAIEFGQIAYTSAEPLLGVSPLKKSTVETLSVQRPGTWKRDRARSTSGRDTSEGKVGTFWQTHPSL